MERQRAHAVLAFHLFLIVIFARSDARFVRIHPKDVSLLPLRENDALPVTHAVNDVGPAVKNATQVALAKAKHILTRYSDALRILSIPAGLVVTFVGNFLVTPVLFVAGFLSGGGISFIATKAAIGTDTPAAAWASIAAMIVGGTVVAFLTVPLFSVGMFAMGGVLGVMLASVLKPSVLGHIYPKNEDVGFYAGAVVFGLILGVLALRFKRQMLILATAYGGAFAFFFGIGYFAGHFPTGADLTQAEKGHFGGWFVAYCAMTLLFGTLGAFTQFRLAGRRPLVHAGHVEGASNRGFGSWWSDHDDEWGSSIEEMRNLPRNERGKDAEGSKFGGVIVPKEVSDDSDSSAPSGARQFASSHSENGFSNAAKDSKSQGGR